MKNVIAIFALGTLLSGCIATTGATWDGEEIFLIRADYPMVSTHEGRKKWRDGECLKLKLVGNKEIYLPGEFLMDAHNCDISDKDVRYYTGHYKGRVTLDRNNKWVVVSLYYHDFSPFSLNGKYSYVEQGR